MTDSESGALIRLAISLVLLGISATCLITTMIEARQFRARMRELRRRLGL